MAVCRYCDREMTTATSCAVEAMHLDGRRVAMVPNGTEPGWPSGQRCHDCGVQPGGFHHLGCDMQRCPLCRGQMMLCGCRFDEDGPDEDGPDEDDPDEDDVA